MRNDFLKILAFYGLNYKKLSVVLGTTYNSTKSMLSPSKTLPRWAKVMVWMWRLRHDDLLEFAEFLKQYPNIRDHSSPGLQVVKFIEWKNDQRGTTSARNS